MRRESSALRAFFAAVTPLWLAAVTPLAAGATPAQKPPPNPITAQLEQRLKTGGPFDDVVVEVRWPFEAKPASSRVYGSGVGIWDRQVQFRLSQSEVTSILRDVTRTGFGSLRGVIGGVPTERRKEKGQVAVSVGSARKVVVQLEGGEQSAKLRSLAEEFLRASATAAAKGVRVSGFSDAFGKLATGKLAPEVFEVIARRDTGPSGLGKQGGWTLHIHGQTASVRAVKGKAAQEPGRELVLSKADFDALVRLLRESALGTLPRSLYSAENFDVRIQVLQQVCAVKAGPFPGLTPTTHGASQKSFDRILAALLALYGRVEKEGALSPGEPGTSPRPTPRG